MSQETERLAPWAEAAMAQHEQHHAEHARRGKPRTPEEREQQVLDRIEKARKRKPKLKEPRITSAHGAGGKATQTLVDAVFLDKFRNPALEPLGDAAALTVGGAEVAMTTDSFVVSPLVFPGGNIGDLAINGTVNDLAVAGARPRYLSCGFILEEGMDVDELRTIVDSMTAAAAAAGVELVTGDTKVVGKGTGDGCYINTTGIGERSTGHTLGIEQAQPGDAVIVSGPVGEHGITIMLARGELDIEADLTSDTAPLHELCAGLLAATGGVRAMRDATRGGVATILNEVATAAQVAVVVDEAAVPVRDEVRGASELLGIDPLYVACEGRMVAVVAPEAERDALAALRTHPLGAEATVIGHVGDDPPGLVLLKTAFGGTRIMDLLVGDPLPRIC